MMARLLSESRKDAKAIWKRRSFLLPVAVPALPPYRRVEVVKRGREPFLLPQAWTFHLLPTPVCPIQDLQVLEHYAIHHYIIAGKHSAASSHLDTVYQVGRTEILSIGCDQYVT